MYCAHRETPGAGDADHGADARRGDLPGPAAAFETGSAGQPARGTAPLRPDVRAFVLVVDDEEDVRNSIAAILQAAGFAVASAVNGRDAIRLLEELEVDVMVLDVRMPELSGLALLEMLEAPPAAVIVSADPVDTSTRARLGSKVRAYLASRPETGAGQFELPMVTSAIRAVARPGDDHP